MSEKAYQKTAPDRQHLCVFLKRYLPHKCCSFWRAFPRMLAAGEVGRYPKHDIAIQTNQYSGTGNFGIIVVSELC